MTTKGIDCATPLTIAKSEGFYHAGFEFVCRYLVPMGWKRLTAEEAEAISQADLQLISVFETTADRALGGRAAGLKDGAIATQVAAAVGQREGSAIYYAVDFDATAAQMSIVIEYLRAASEASPAFETGVYGSYSVIEAVKAAQVCKKYWQTYAWSYGQKAEGIHIYQYQNDIVVNGIGVDLDESYDDEGFWNRKHEEEAEYMMQATDANKVIAFLAAAYEATTVQEARDEFHRLANELRKASGQPEE